MTERIAWTPDAVKLLIALYEENEFLYNPQSPLYKSREKRVTKYEEIAIALQCYIPDCCALDVKKKINGLRSQYFSEKLKIDRSIKSGIDYKPSVYWFYLLTFLEYVTESTESISVTDDDVSTGEKTQIENDPPAQVIIAPPGKKTKPNVIAIRHEPGDGSLVELSPLLITKQQEDSYDIFGKYVSCELRELSQTGHLSLVIQAKKKIQQAIMDAWDILVDEASNSNLEELK